MWAGWTGLGTPGGGKAIPVGAGESRHQEGSRGQEGGVKPPGTTEASWDPRRWVGSPEAKSLMGVTWRRGNFPEKGSWGSC